jgi:hypothetical protein
MYVCVYDSVYEYSIYRYIYIYIYRILIHIAIWFFNTEREIARSLYIYTSIITVK